MTKHHPYKVVLFDVDGVLIIPPKMFSHQYCEKYGIDPKVLSQFYSSTEFKNASIGKFDLKDAIKLHNDKWQWDGEPEELLSMWFEGENCPNQKLLEIVERLRSDGTPVYIATQQEKYRAAFLKNVVFKDKVDGMFVSCEIGEHKHTAAFWRSVLESLERDHPGLEPGEILYFDDKQSIVDAAGALGIQACLYTRPEDVTIQLKL